MRTRAARPDRIAAAAIAGVLAASSLLVPSAAAEGTPGDRSSGRRSTWRVEPTLVARAELSADFIAPGPPSGALATPANGRTGPFPGQVIPGFSAMIDNGDGTFWAQPDNGFGSKANSADFLLRLYRIRPHWETKHGGPGTIEVGEFISLRDPDRRLPFPIVNESTPERLLTGGDLDIESVVRAPDGTFWIGEEFGPFIVHVDATGKVLAPPIDFVDGKSPAHPLLAPGETPRVRSSRGFEAMAGSKDGSKLYPIVEGPFADETNLRRRYIYEVDTATMTYTGRTWAYETDQAGDVIGDAAMLDRGRMLIIERDDLEGSRSVIKRLYTIDLRTDAGDGFVHKELTLDALKIANPYDIGVASNPGAYGMDDPFAFALQSFEVALVLRDGRILLGNDNNYPGSNGRVPGTPDDTEMVVVDLRTVKVRGGTAEPTVIAHRGASGYRPEHTLAAYELAILQCADYIEPDVVSTLDGELVARHENEISGTTDVATRPEFADRQTTKVIDGVTVTGWFTEDFTIAELKTLRAKERLPAVRTANTAHDGLYEIPTLDEVLDLARNSRTCDGEPVGVYAETKHPTYFDSIGLSMEERLVQLLDANGYGGKRSKAYIQSFETANLRDLDAMTDVRLVQLVSCSGAPYDFVAAGLPYTYADLVTWKGLGFVRRYADGVGLCKDVMIPRDADGNLLAPTPVIRRAHRRGLTVHGWTFRVENQFLPVQFRSGDDPNAPGDLTGEIRAFLRAGMDGFFTDQPDVGVAAAG